MEKSSFFSGDVEACLRFIANNQGKFNPEFRELIGGFTKASVDQVNIWLKGKSLPGGERLIRLIHYLEFSNFTVSDISDFPDYLLKIRRIVAFDIMDPASIAGFVGLSNGHDEIVKFMRGKRQLSEDKTEKLKSFADEFEELVQRKMAETVSLVVANNYPAVGEKKSAINLTKKEARLVPPARSVDIPESTPVEKAEFLEQVEKKGMISGGQKGALDLVQRQARNISHCQQETIKSISLLADSLIVLLHLLQSEFFSSESMEQVKNNQKLVILRGIINQIVPSD